MNPLRIGRSALSTVVVLSVMSSARAAWPYDKQWVADTTAAQSAGSWNFLGIAISSDGSKRTVAQNTYYLWTSSDYGSTYTQDTSIGTQLNWQGVEMSDDGSVQAAWCSVSTDALYTSADTGATWTIRDPTGNSAAWADVAINGDGTRMTAVSRDTGATNGGIYTSADSGVTWTSRGQTTTAWRGVAMSSDGADQTAVSTTDIWTSSDYGATWSQVSGTTATWAPAGRQAVPVAMSANGLRQVAATHTDNIWYSGDTGATWTEVTGFALTGSKFWAGISSSADGSKMVAAVYAGYFWVSTDYGASWTEDTRVIGAWRAIDMGSDGDEMAACGSHPAGLSGLTYAAGRPFNYVPYPPPPSPPPPLPSPPPPSPSPPPPSPPSPPAPPLPPAPPYPPPCLISAAGTPWTERTGGNTLRRGPRTTARFGSSVAIGVNGGAAVIAAGEPDWEDSGAKRGLVRVLRYSGSWSQRGSDIEGTASRDDYFGRSVALSSDGSILAVGASGAGGAASGVAGPGAVKVNPSPLFPFPAAQLSEHR